VNKPNIPEGGMKIDELAKFGPFGDMEEGGWSSKKEMKIELKSIMCKDVVFLGIIYGQRTTLFTIETKAFLCIN
jgi:hypothetical protein